MEDLLADFLPFALGMLTVLASYTFWKRSRNAVKDISIEEVTEEEEKKSEEPVAKNPSKPKKVPAVKRKEVKDTYSHPWLLASLKGHSGEILDLDFSSNGKQLASCAEDRAVMLRNAKTFTEKNHRSVRANIEFDHVTRIKWSPDSKAFIVSVAAEHTVQIYKVGKKNDGSLGNVEILKFAENHTADILNISIACNGHFIMSCSSGTTLIVRDLKACSQPPVIKNLGAPATTTLAQSSTLLQEKKEEIQAQGLSKISHSSHQYQPSVRAIVTAVVTQMSAVHPVPLPSSLQTKCSINTTSTASSSVLITPELPVVYSSANIPPTSISEHISNISCKPVSLPTPLTSEQQSNIPLGKEAHVFTSSTTPVTTTWASTKVSSNRITDVHGHVNTIQTSSINNPVFTTKSESRSKVAHGKSTSAFTQQSAFPLTSYEASVLSGAHNISAVSNTSGGMIAELLQQQHKEYFAAAVAASGQLQERMQGQVVRAATPVASSIPPDIAAARRGNPTPPHTPTPPVTSANHSPLLMHAAQPALIVPPHPSLPLHPSELNAYVHHHLFAGAALNHYASPIHSDMHAQQEAQVRAAVIGMNPRYGYSIPPTAVPTNSFRQPTDSRLQPSVMDAKSEQKLINDLSKIVHETRGSDEKSLHSVKSGRSKKEDKEVKVIHSDREDHESRHIPVHEKIPSTSAITPHSLRQQQHAAHYSSTIRQLSPRLTVSPHDRTTDSPIVANVPYAAGPYAAGQSRVPQISISGQVDEHKPESLSLSSHHYKSDAAEPIKPPVAHQTQPSTLPYHSLNAAVHPSSRQQMLGVLQIGSPASGHIDGRTSNPAHSPSSHIYKKDSSHSLPMSSLHNPATDKRVNSEHSKKSSISPGPAGMAPAHSPLPWHIQSHNSSHSSIAQSPHVILPTNEQSSRRVNSHMTSQLGSEVPVHAPPPAHAMSQPSNVPRTLPQTPPHASQVPSDDAYILLRYPVMWQGLLALKNDQAAVQMHFVSGNPNVTIASLPPIVDGETAPVRISQRMRLEQTQLDGVFRKIQLVEEHCILMALPCGKDQNDVVQQSSNLKTAFINYLMCKNAAGIVITAAPGSQQPAFVIHIFPSCEFIESKLSRIAPSLLHLVSDIPHLVIIIATV